MGKLSEECRKAFPASKSSLQAAAVRHRYLLQANICLGSTHAGAWEPLETAGAKEREIWIRP